MLHMTKTNETRLSSMQIQATVANQNDPVLECRDLKKYYSLQKKDIPVLQGIDLSVKKGEICIITGKSGAGKSTLLGLLAALDRPTSGSIHFEGGRIENWSNEKLTRLRREKMGIIFQNFNLLPSWTAFENVEAALLHTGPSKTVRAQKVKTLLTELGLGDRLDNLPSQLSVGQQQRVAIARALANEPTLILADEPTGDVDPETGQEIIQLLLALVKEKGVTLIISTHGTFPLECSQNIFILKDGKLGRKE
jgi:putative ABC transport system ATP-binding protein